MTRWELRRLRYRIESCQFGIRYFATLEEAITWEREMRRKAWEA